MLRGELSNQPAPICAIDWRVLLDESVFRKKSLRFAHYLATNMSGLSATTKKVFSLRNGAKEWLERNWETRFCVVSIREPRLRRLLIDAVFENYVSDIVHFDKPIDLRLWLKSRPEIYRCYTHDTGLLSVFDEVVKLHSGWGEKL